MQATPQRKAPRGPGIPGAPTSSLAREWNANDPSFIASPLALPFPTAQYPLQFKNLFLIPAAIVLGFLTTSCSHAAPLLREETTRGPVQYSLHSPETPARKQLILAHGFLRSPQTMAHLAESFAKNGIETA